MSLAVSNLAEESLAINEALNLGAAQIWTAYDILAAIADRESRAAYRRPARLPRHRPRARPPPCTRPCRSWSATAGPHWSPRCTGYSLASATKTHFARAAT